MNRFRLLAAALLFALPLTACVNNEERDEERKEGGNEVPVALLDLPPAVRATLERKARGGQIAETEKETKNGRLIYSADLKINGQTWDISVAADGTIISKEMEKAGEQGEKDEKNEK